jgi:hypothetical protein
MKTLEVLLALMFERDYITGHGNEKQRLCKGDGGSLSYFA